MLAPVLTTLGFALFLILLLFAVRRSVFLLTLWRPQRPSPELTGWPDVLLLVPARDELASLPGLVAALAQLDYPPEHLAVALIDDGSTDGTGRAMAEVCAGRPRWHTLSLPHNVGKPAALNHALAAHTFGEIVYIFDVDHRPRPDCLRAAVRAFADPQVAGVSGRTVPANSLASPVAFYATLEALVHQLITVRGKDVLRLGPPLLGSNNAYRRSALAAVGGFRPGAFLEDSDLTLALHLAGFSTRYVPNAQAALTVPFTVPGFVRQHVRWGRGFNDVARAHLPSLLRDQRLAPGMRLELALFALGYLDRLALLGSLGLLLLSSVFGIEPARTLALAGIALNVGLPFAQIVAVLARERAPAAWWRRLAWVPVFFGLDAAVAVWSLALTVLDRPRLWTRTERAVDA